VAACTVLIAASDMLDTLKQRVADTGEVLAFTDSDSIRALDVISQRRPDVVALDRLFAASTRGSAFINRLVLDPHLSHSEIRVISQGAAPARPASEPARTPADAAIDASGTRRAGRITIQEGVEVSIDGVPAEIIDLSIGGAQVISTSVLRPNQWVRLVLRMSRRRFASMR
jgi:hypothetical protein